MSLSADLVASEAALSILLDTASSNANATMASTMVRAVLMLSPLEITVPLGFSWFDALGSWEVEMRLLGKLFSHHSSCSSNIVDDLALYG